MAQKEQGEPFPGPFFSSFLLFSGGRRDHGYTEQQIFLRQTEAEISPDTQRSQSPRVPTVTLLSCHHLQINYGLTSVTAMSRRRCFKIFVADQLLDSPSLSPWLIVDTLTTALYKPINGLGLLHL